MRTTHRFSAALTRPWLIAAAALATLTTMIFLLHPPATHADPASGTVVSTAKTSLGRDPRQLARTHALPVRKGQERQERLHRDVRDLLAASDRGR